MDPESFSYVSADFPQNQHEPQWLNPTDATVDIDNNQEKTTTKNDQLIWFGLNVPTYLRRYQKRLDRLEYYLRNDQQTFRMLMSELDCG